MQFVANEKTVPRLHLIGTLFIVLVLTLLLGAFFSWQYLDEHRASLARIEQVLQQQKEARLAAEMRSAISYLEFTRSRTEDVLRRSLVEQVDNALQVAEAIHARESARRSPAELRQLIVEALRPVRFFDGRGYFFIDDMQGQFILLPTAPQMEGKTVLDNQDDTGHYIMRGLIEAARKPRGEGFTRYRWYMPDDPKRMADKLAYVRHFAPYDWLIGAGDYTYKWEAMQQQEARERLRALRFGESGYFVIQDRAGHLLLSPSDGALEGVHFNDMPEALRPVGKQIHETAQRGGGIIQYNWRNPATGKVAPKTALIQVIEPWGWAIAATIFDDELQATLSAELARQKTGGTEHLLHFLAVILIALALGLGASWLFSRWSSRLFRAYHQTLDARSAALRESEGIMRSFYELGLVGLAITSPDKGWLRINGYLCDLLGYSEEELRAKTWADLTHPDDLAADDAQFDRLLRGEIDGYSLEKRFISRSGKVIFTRLVVRCVRKPGGTVDFATVMIDDITENKRIESDLRIAATTFETQEGIVITDVNAVILRVNQAFTRITGYSAEDAVGKTPRILSSGRQDAEFYAAMWQQLLTQGNWQGEIWNRRKNGEVFPEWLTITAVSGSDGVTSHYVATLSDITQRKAAEDEIKWLAFYDPLTRLPNRRLLADRLHQALVSASRHKRHGALMLLDMDNFKMLNDTLGHDVGDQFLREVAERVRCAVREGDTVARLGGDEFIVILEDLDQEAMAAAQAEAVAVKIQAALNEPYQLNTQSTDRDAMRRNYHCTSSIGIALFRDTAVSVDELLKRADTAMYQAKAMGRNTLRFYDPEMQAVVSARAALEVDLRSGLEEKQFVLHIQPQVDTSGRVTGGEVLVRWQCPQRGLVAPTIFIPLAEETGLILPLGRWVLESACQLLARWSADPATADLSLAVNVSARQFRHPDFVSQVRSILDSTGASPHRLKLELTESLLLDDIDDVIEKMTGLRQIGVAFSLDDFGTGYSSLSYLKRLPLSQLKIDRSFVRDILVNANDAVIAGTVVALGRSMGLEVIAEGVETEAQRDFLATQGCHHYQGYLFGRPQPIADFERLLLLR